MKKNIFSAAALVVAAATAVLTSCSSEWFSPATVDTDYSVIYNVSTSVENGCPTATATGTAFADGVTEATATLKVTLAEETIAIPSDSEFGTAYTSGDWTTGFTYSDGQSATVTFNSSSSQLVLTDLVFNEDKTVVTPAADGMSATVTLSYTATLNYVVDGVTEATAQVELTPWYTQYKVENTPSVVEPTYSYDYDSDIELARDGGSILLTKWDITRIWNGEMTVFSIPNMITVAMVPMSAIDDPQTVMSLEYNDYGVSVGDATVATKEFGNYKRVSETRSVTAELHMTSPAGGDLSTIDDNFNIMSSVVTFTDPETGYTLSVDMTMNVADHKVSFVDNGLDYVQLHEETVKKDYWTTLQYEVTFSSSSTAVPQWNNSSFAQYIHEKNLSHGNIIE
jgi:hypothetical protein